MGMGGNGNGNGFMGMGGNGNRNSPSRTPLLAVHRTHKKDLLKFSILNFTVTVETKPARPVQPGT